MRGLLLATLLSSPALAAAPPAQAVSALLTFTPPKGWALESYANADGADPVLSYSKGADAVQIRAFGAPGSDYPAPKDFLGEDVPGEDSVTVAGRKLPLYRRRFPLEIRDPHRPSKGKIPQGTELFCILPLRDKRYAVLSYRRESPAPGLDGSGQKAWEVFLRTVRPRR